MRVIECEVVRDDELEALPYESVVPYSTDDVADSLVVQVIVAPVAVVDEATEEMVGGVRSEHADVSNERIDPYPVPAEFVVYARK